ncbi:hypothetical protein [Lacisediminihabitans profunda]|uniref:Cell division protein FtsL n=1 Tax=Lacisediminihabitans profunda TaxID=2594790 RepID=A0A5C8UQE5_9MICO|nr:hypothetical protein [Lacisediminihabitans profunda]TXN30677.1 hypothetical protein FVP33_09190 [Lacisediminihabitans profunda]
MTMNLALAQPELSMPARSPREVEEHPRHIEIVTTRSQRRARPRVVYALVAVTGLFVILIAQLLLSIVLSQGSYDISALQATHKELSRDQQALSENLRVLESPQNLAGRAEQLGMVLNTSGYGWLRLSDGAVLAAPTAADAASTVGANGAALIPNVLLTPEMLASQSAAPGATGATTTGTAAGAPATAGTGGSVASQPGALPAPNTH